ncbi:MAG: site-specific integrase [Planctomycetaceae bacterium]|nr:site-specific integrase [Planctomycetales bacterium]MCB9924499.1 site-specific integrase [Planctomycetaceae bacterium]
MHRLSENIDLVEQGRLDIPTDADIPSFLLSDGKLANKVNVKRKLSLSDLFANYTAAIPQGSLEQNTLDTAQIHMDHIKRILGMRLATTGVTSSTLQDYVLQRANEKGRRGKPVSSTTIKKELGTFGSAWSWAMHAGHVSKPFPKKGLRFPKETEKPPFQTWSAIEGKISRNQLSDEEQAELWECLFLTVPQITELLSHIEESAFYPYMHPMMTFAAFTGARRSELMRSRVDDIDLRGETAIIREKKRVRGRLTTRRVPISPQLKPVLECWFAIHPGGNFTFCHPSCGQASKPIAKEQARDHFKRTLANSKWKVLHGWHIFRHSFCSNCAAAGVDQRVINAWVGHQTEEMVKRYRHLIPNQEQAAMQQVFGKPV